ncbi:MAG: type 2 lanthipeptide synthetase LanM family protein [Pseudomonadota bacterium]
MDTPLDRIVARAATIDELLAKPGSAMGCDAGIAERRLAAWCRSAANGDSQLFARRLARDGLSLEKARNRLAAAFPSAGGRMTGWSADAAWVEAGLYGDFTEQSFPALSAEPRPFQHLLGPLVAAAEARLWHAAGEDLRKNFTDPGLESLRLMLLDQLSDLCAPPLYERFAAMRERGEDSQTSAADRAPGTAAYSRFVADMRSGGFRILFDEKPVLLRLIAILARQWIDSVCEFAIRLDKDLAAVRRDLAGCDRLERILKVDGGLSDRHNNGRSVFIVTFEDGVRAVYKPKDLRLDVAWNKLIARLNGSSPPLALRAARTIARDHYGWTEFIDHTGCADESGCDLYFRRAGAWLALFHCFAATDMHQENVIAAGDHPVPIDLETILQPTPAPPKNQEPESEAFDAATRMIADSVMAVGVLPAYGRAPDTSIFAMGALTADWNARIRLEWLDINTDGMRPTRAKVVENANPNLPHAGGRYARFGEHVDAFLAGFEDYARFLSQLSRGDGLGGLFDGFSGVTVRKVVRPTRFYAMLLQRLKTHRSMDDGAAWSAQADFIARLSDWEAPSDPTWGFHRAERSALLALNVPHFVVPSDGHGVRDCEGPVATLTGLSGLERARERVRQFDKAEIEWQLAVIKANTAGAPPKSSADVARLLLRTDVPIATDSFASEADRIAAEISEHAIRRGRSAAWIGLDWMGDAEAFQLAPLGPDLYNGLSGIAVFLSAHASVTGHGASAELALAALTHLRKKLKDRNSARFVRSLGIGGATGLGSLIYALAVIAKNLGQADILSDAHAASALMIDELIAADKRLDALGGSAGAILALLRLYRDTQSSDVLARAVACGEHLLRQERTGIEGMRSWVGIGLGEKPLNGMSHGAAGFAYALASLAEATGRNDFHRAASECLAFENATYNADRHNWPDLRHKGEPGWACRWCHGAPGIGLARAALLKRSGINAATLQSDIRNALVGVEENWPTEIDTLCCGTLGSVEFMCEAGDALGRPDVRRIAAQRLAAVVEAARINGDYRWNSGRRRFNLGLFRGLAGVGYTLLRQRDNALPNVLIWE